jgi:hypothetical protein
VTGLLDMSVEKDVKQQFARIFEKSDWTLFKAAFRKWAGRPISRRPCFRALSNFWISPGLVEQAVEVC